MRVIGTAGHVDHAKSTLIRALTGIDPDPGCASGGSRGAQRPLVADGAWSTGP
jgi:GTPase